MDTEPDTEEPQTPSVFGSPAHRQFFDTAIGAEYVRSAAPMEPTEKLAEGSYGSISQFSAFPEHVFVVKDFKGNESNYAKGVLDILTGAHSDPDNSLSQFIVWSYDFRGFNNRERVIMEPLTPWDDAMIGFREQFRGDDDTRRKGIETSKLLEAFEKWLSACIKALEENGLYAPDLKAANMAYCKEEGSNYQFRLIDTDGFITKDNLTDFVSTYLYFLTDDGYQKEFRPEYFKRVALGGWKTSLKQFLKALHRYIQDMMCLEAKCFLYEGDDVLSKRKYVKKIRCSQAQFIKAIKRTIVPQVGEDLMFGLNVFGPLRKLWKREKDNTDSYFSDTHKDRYQTDDLETQVKNAGLKVTVKRKAGDGSANNSIVFGGEAVPF